MTLCDSNVPEVGGDFKFFVGCDAIDTIDGVTLESIVNYAFKRIGYSRGTDEKDSYDKFCAELRKKLGSPEPYMASLVIKDWRRDKIVDNMWELMPHKVDDFKNKIEKVADYAVGKIDPNVNNAERNKLYEHRGFAVVKIFKSGANLELIPAYMHVKGSLTETIGWFSDTTHSESTLEYMHEKYVLTEFDIKAIVEIEKNVKGKWD